MIQVKMEHNFAIFGFFLIFQLFSSSLAAHHPLTEANFTCRAGWTQNLATCYLDMNIPMPWEHAYDACKNEGGSLVKIEDSVENCYVRGTFNHENIWIGLSRLAEEGIDISGEKAVWDKREVVPYEEGFWDINQPDTADDKNECVAANKASIGRWSFTNCLTKLPFVCKQKAVLNGYFQCLNGDAIPMTQKCDGDNDCGDNSDEIDCPTRCHFLLTGESGSASSKPYQDKKTCTWLIVAPVGSKVKLEIRGGSEIEKNADFVDVLSGARTVKASRVIGEVTGEISPSKMYYSYNNLITLRLNTDSSVVPSGGLMFSWTSESDNDVDTLTATDTWEILKNKHYPTYIQLSLQKEWIVKAMDDKNVVTIKFNDYSLPSGSFMILYDGNYMRYKHTMTAMPSERIYTSTSNYVKILVSTPKMGIGKGISISYKQGCSIEITDSSSDEIVSPGFKHPAGYPNNVMCNWYIKPSHSRPISLRFLSFNLNQDSNTNFDYVKIYNDTANTPLHTESGFTGSSATITENIYRSSDGILNITFESNLALRAAGFQARFDTDCMLTTTLTPWTQTDPPIQTYTPFDAEITFTCDNGYSFVQEEYNSMSSVSIKCEGTKWNVTRIPYCRITYCGTPPAIDNGFIEAPSEASSGAVYNANATYKCDGGFTIDKETISCQATGDWETKPKCTAASCPVVPVVTNGNHKIIDGNLREFGNVIQFNCSAGYQLVGSLQIFCKTNGQWSYAAPECKEITCPIPVVTAGSLDATQGVLFDQTTTLRCDSGFQVNGTTMSSQTLTCGEDGMFDDPQGKNSELLCVDIDECDTGTPCQSTEECKNSPGSYFCECKDGFEGAGPCTNTDECQTNNGGCSHTCSDNTGNTPYYICLCPTGYEIYEYDGFNNISLAMGEDGKREGDVYYINHTCVRKQCEKPPVPPNGMILTNKDLFYYEDTVEYMCNHGYLINVATIRTCDANGQWTGVTPVCNIATCTTQLSSSSVDIQRVLPLPGVTIEYGDESTIECSYGTSMINRTQYCGYTGSDTYALLGDSDGCPVIDCGTPEIIPGSQYTQPSATIYGEAFNFGCETGFLPGGSSSLGNYKVKCEENGRWGWGNLTCTGKRCSDPRTPGGAVQVVTSYEVGELVYFNCTRDGYEARPTEPLACEMNAGEAEWNQTTLPMCKDVTAPVFSNCPADSDIIYVDYMEAAMYRVPTATDNSGVVKQTTVNPAYFKPETVVSDNVDVTYETRDYDDNTANCVIKIRIKPRLRPTLTCPQQRAEHINSSMGHQVDITDIVSVIPTNSRLTITPSETVTVNAASIYSSEQEISVTAEDPYGTSVSCSFLITTSADACFKESLAEVPFTSRDCGPDTSNNMTDVYKCTDTCSTGYVYGDGKLSREYRCEGTSTWTPNSTGYCLPYTESSYRIEISVTFSLSLLGQNCITNHNIMLNTVVYRNNLATKLTTYCDNLFVASDNIIVTNEATSTYNSFTITSKLVVTISSTEDVVKELCGNTIELQIGRNAADIFSYGASATCDGNVPSTISVVSGTVLSQGNLCPGGGSLLTTDIGEKCVSCPPGTHLVGTTCTACPNGQYQDEAGKSECKQCGQGTIPSLDKTKCEDSCPSGFHNDVTYKSPCDPCPVDTYWVNSSYCETCPSGYSTLNSTATKSLSGCKAPCSLGTYSVTGYEPCTECPLHHYQDSEASTTCTRCALTHMTENTGSNSTNDCIPSTVCNATVDCSGNGVCDNTGHTGVCTCNTGYTRADCSLEQNPCDSTPCFNGGTCVRDGISGYNCTCPVDDTCRMVRESGSYTGTPGGENTNYPATLETCESDCINSANCKAIHHTQGYCFVYIVDTIPTVYALQSTFAKKVCDYTVLFSGDQCEKDEVDSCVNNTQCGDYGMCQDHRGSGAKLSTFECLCQREGEFLPDSTTCERKIDLCNPDPCGMNGDCESFGDIRRQCTCHAGYTGENCETNIKECLLHPKGCLYDGECKDGTNTYTCDCKTGFGGERCQIPADLCSQDPCNNGVCYNNYDNYTSVCVCEHPYQLGSNGKCEALPACDGITCVNGTCVSGVCECQPGYEGAQCQHDIDDCKSNQCKNGECVNGYNSYTCSCATGYTGDMCENDIPDCPGSCDMTKTKHTRDKVDDCECICHDGYKGKNCTEEINECDSYPCKHDSECTDEINDYKCNCTKGWTGKDCGEPEDFCSTKPCKNGGDCHNLIDGYFCSCNPGTGGDTCEIFPNVCSVTSPCTSDGTCWDTGGTAKCNCTQNYTGDSCSLIKDSCSEENTCKNGGTCVTKDIGYECQCASSFSGGNCEIYTDPCDVGSKCNSRDMCKSDKDKHLCLCPEGRPETDSGCKDTEDNWDMLFDTKVGEDGGFLRTPFELGGQQFSIMFWTRFRSSTDNKKPTLVQLETSNIRDQFASPVLSYLYPDLAAELSQRVIVKIDNDSVYFSNATDSKTIPLGGSVNLGDGVWHHVAVTWNAGMTEIVVDGIRQDLDSSETVTFSQLPEYIQVVIGQNMNGRISRVKIWKTALSFIDHIVHASNDVTFAVSEPLAQGWTNYILSRGSQRVFPSKVKEMVCDLEVEDSSCTAIKHKRPVVDKCPLAGKEIKEVGRLHEVPGLVENTDITFTSDSRITFESTLPEDRIYVLGASDEIVIGKDEYGNYAECRFKVYVHLPFDCSAIGFTPTYCSGSYDSYICGHNCESGQELSIPVPKKIRCGKMNKFYAENVCDIDWLVAPAVYLPVCGVKDAGIKRKLDVKMKYKFVVDCSSSFVSNLETKIKETFNGDIRTNWPDLCNVPNCPHLTLNVMCSSSTTDTTLADVTMILEDLETTVTYNLKQYTLIEAMRMLIFIKGVFIYTDVGGAVLVKESVQIEELKFCFPGYAIKGDDCILCPAGSKYVESTASCELCEVGTYQPSTGQPNCMECDPGKTTHGKGSISCIEECSPGFDYNFTSGQCDPCPKHYYQNEAGKYNCYPCPVGKKTSGVGSNSSADCFDDCPTGTALQIDGSCKPCPQGFYRESSDDVCVSCTSYNETMTTEDEGTKTKEGCKIRICSAGTFRNSSTNECEPCPVGQYQPNDLQDSCELCEASYSTNGTGRTNETECIFFCPPGKEVESAREEKCRPCARGTYRDNEDDQQFMMCLDCPEGNTTEGPGKTSESDCFITECYAGNFRNVTTNLCEKCPRGQYQPMDLMESCTLCNPDYFTRNEGSVNESYCEYHCKPGHELKDEVTKTCAACPRGYYRDNILRPDQYFVPCQPCPEGNTTERNQSTSLNDCSIFNCSMGEIIGLDGGCKACGIGTYQDMDSPMSATKCTKCPDGSTTRTDNSIARSQCEPYCIAGSYYNTTTTKCEFCPKGTYNNGNDTMKFDVCFPCKENYTTESEGSKSNASCNLLDCDPGYKIVSDTCEPCGFASYQSLRHQTECKDCSTNQNTSTETSTSQTDCQAFCPAGETGNATCEKCPADTFKPQAGVSVCQPCTGNYTSDINRRSCDLLFCDKGYKHDAIGSTCIACDKGSYKKSRGNDGLCVSCGDELTTLNMASDSEADCDQKNCNKGRYLDVATGECKNCSTGSYKDTEGNQACTPCWTNRTTASTGSIDVSSCSIVVCEAGEKRIPTTNSCEKCPRGTYQTNRGQSSCTDCQDISTTMMEASTLSSDCVPLCQLGKEYNAGSRLCTKCILGFYKDSVSNDVRCVRCSEPLKTTNRTGAEAESECTEDICGKGTKRENNVCVNCDRGQYQDELEQTSCKQCGTDRTTVYNGSKSFSDCILDCVAGQYYNYPSGTCLPCSIGWYTDKDIDCCKCIKCPNNKITAFAGSNSCIDREVPTVAPTLAPSGRRILVFKYRYRARLDCSDSAVRLSFIFTLRIKIIGERIKIKRRKYKTLCPAEDCATIIAKINIKIFLCGGTEYRYKRQTDQNIAFDVELPDVDDTATDPSTGTTVETASLLTEDFNANSEAYTDQESGLQPMSVESLGFTTVCNSGYVLVGSTCVACARGSYYNETTQRCEVCSRNTYQDLTAQLTCKNCTRGVKTFTLANNSTSENDCVSLCATTSGYCKNGGTCKDNNVAVFCTCPSRYTGEFCQTFQVPESSTDAIIGGAVGGGAALLLLVLIIVGICVYFRSPSRQYERKSDPIKDYESDLYRNPVYDRPLALAYPNRSFLPAQDDYEAGDAVYNPYSKNPGKPTMVDEESSQFRWNPTS